MKAKLCAGSRLVDSGDALKKEKKKKDVKFWRVCLLEETLCI